MAGRTPIDYDSLQPLTRELDEIKRRLRELETPTGTQKASLLNQVQTQLASIDARVTAAVSANSYTRAQIDSKVANPGDISPGNVSASGTVTATGKIGSVDTYNRSLTYGGQYKIQYVHQDGSYGFVSSSRRFKQDITTAEIPDLREVMRALRVVTFRYIDAVDNIGDAAATEWGVIAEELHDLGLTWLVIYDGDGLPEGVRFERFAFLALMDAQDKQAQLDALAERVAALEA